MHSLSSGAIERFEDLVRHEVEDKAIPSISYALVSRDGLLATKHIQRQDRHFNMTPQTCFRIGSITKTFTAVALMQLVERGLVDLDVDVSEYIPGFRPLNPFAGREGGPHGSQISLRKLLSHTAGIVREPKSGHYLDATRPPLEDTVAELASSTLKQDPSLGEMHYSNAGIAIAGLVIERISQKSYADYITENILKPLHMDGTSSGMANGIRERLAPADMWTLDGDTPAPVFSLGGSPAGNIFSTPTDMAHYMQCLLRGGFTPDGRSIVSPASIKTMWTPIGKRPTLDEHVFNGYGLCFGIADVDGWVSAGHGGAVYGYASQMTLLPQAGYGVLILATLDFANQITTRLAAQGLRILLAEDHMGSMPKPVQKSLPVSQQQLAQLPGFFQNATTGEIIEIKAAGGNLYLMGDGVPLQIRPKSETDFIINGRIYPADSDYPHKHVAFPSADRLDWKGASWTRTDMRVEDAVPAELADHLGEYGPDFNMTYLTYSHGKLKCLIEYFFTHDCEPVDAGRYRMRGMLYEEEVLELDASDDKGRKGIRVGPMFLERRPTAQ